MKKIDIFYQGEGILGIEHLEADSDNTFNQVKKLITEKHGLENDVFLFLEDSDEPIDDSLIIQSQAGKAGIKAHIHQCKHIEVSVTFAGETVHRQFSPGTTIARVKRWAAEKKFKMAQEDAGEHVLQITGSNDRPTPGTHLGSLAIFPACSLAFDLVADQRINGFRNLTIVTCNDFPR